QFNHPPVMQIKRERERERVPEAHGRELPEELSSSCIMSFFGKLKTSVLHSGPPAPPRRTDNRSAYGWPEGEFDEEDGDTYEAPPCDRPTIKVQPRQVEEDVYLGFPDRPPNPSITKRQAAPPPRPAKITPVTQNIQLETPPQDSEEFYIDPNEGKSPEVVRKDKPDKKAPIQRPLFRPPAALQKDEEVYLDPHEGQSLHLPEARMKPPVPRAKSVSTIHTNTLKYGLDPKEPNHLMFPQSSLLVSDAACKVVPLEVRRSTLSAQLPPPVSLNVKSVPLDTKLSPPPPSLDSSGQLCILHPLHYTHSLSFHAFRLSLTPVLNPNVVMSHPLAVALIRTIICILLFPLAAFASGVKPTAQGAGLQDREWFAGVCDRKTAEESLFRINKDGAFLVRFSNSQKGSQPYTLVVLYRQTVYNIPLFGSLQEMISHHTKNPILLIDRKSQAKHSTLLLHPARP
ncbi:hypothetical protein DNTS_014494, partial [Danionella cerebrum]